ncbi:MAG: aminotransferase class I/II-fold pyridoxal phosphate-dependent enzyme [Thermanaerothrix sp.]|nr:aminotransferase class I/II-fold pyridoxal phosphate-dependent enzyme [Thermanaerothrix sp.]
MAFQESANRGLLKGSQAVSRQLPAAIREEIRGILRDLSYNVPRNDGCISLRRGLGDLIGESHDNILVFGSSADPFRDLALSMRSPRVLMPWSCGGAGEVFAFLGCEVISVPLDYDGKFSFPMESFLDRWSSCRPEVVYVDVPNDPTGINLSTEDLATLSGLCGDSLWILDQRYAEFSRQDPYFSTNLIKLWRGRGGLGIIRSLSFAWGLGGMDMCYMIWKQAESMKFQSANRLESPRNEILTHLVKRCSGWMESRTYSCRYIRDEFAKGCSKIPGVEVYPGDGPFVLLGFNCKDWEDIEGLFSQREWVIPVKAPNINIPFLQVFATSEEELSRLLADILSLMGDHWHTGQEDGAKVATA